MARDATEFAYEFDAWPEGPWAVAGLALVVALCWAVVWMYRREGRIGATLRLRMVLAAIRCVVILTLAAIWLEPVRVRYIRRWIDSYTLVLLDDSASMGLADTYRDATTADRVKAALDTDDLPPTTRASIVRHILGAADRRFLHALAENNRVKLYTFSDELRFAATVRAAHEIPADDTAHPNAASAVISAADVPLDFGARGSATNIERSLRRAVESLATAPIAGVVVISDGGFNQGGSADSVAQYARERHIPVYTVGVGDPAAPRNLRIAELAAPQRVFKQDPFAVSVRLAAQGMAGERVRVELRRNAVGDDGPTTVVDTKTVEIGADATTKDITFHVRPTTAGRFVYHVATPVRDFESVADDNAKHITVSVIDARMRVLLVAGAPGWDYRFLSRLLERDRTFDVSCWLQSADYAAVRDGNTIIDHLPRTPHELFEYDVIVLMDVDRRELDQPWCELIDRFVTDYGGGLLMTAARAHTPALMRDTALKRLTNLLPVTLDPEADLILNTLGHYQTSPAPVEIPQAAHGHPILRLADPTGATAPAWRNIGDIYWHYPVRREKPVATVLMRHGDPRMRNAFGGHVLAAVQFAGAGRTGFLAFDATWRWRAHGERVFDRFWVQWLRYLAEGKRLGGTKRGLLRTDSDHYAIGEAVTVTARALNDRYEPLHRDRLTARYTVDGEPRPLTLRAQNDRPGWFEGRFVPDRTGVYRITMTVPGADGAGTPDVTRDIRVARPNIEIIRPQMDRASLVTLARQSAGGRYLDVDEARHLPDLIPDRHEETTVKSRPMPLWDNAVILTVLVSLLVLEWGLRKGNRLL